MTVRKILGKVDHKQGNHAVAKLSNGQYAVGNIRFGRCAANSNLFDDFDQAFAYWVETLHQIPTHHFNIAR